MNTKRSLFAVARQSMWVWAGTILLLIGLPFFILAIVFMGQERKFDAEGRTVEGIVLTKNVGRDRDNNRKYSVRYRFTAPDGSIREGRSELSEERWSEFVENGPIRILYLPDKPGSHRIEGESKWTLLVIFVVVGVLLTLGGGFMFLRGVRRSWISWRLQDSGVQAPATVVDVVPMNLQVNGITQWRIHYEYRDRQGQKHKARRTCRKTRRGSGRREMSVTFCSTHPLRRSVEWIGKNNGGAVKPTRPCGR